MAIIEKTCSKIEKAMDVLCDKVFEHDKGFHVSSELYNMCFEEEFDEADIESFLLFCELQQFLPPYRLFDVWYESTKIHQK